MIRKIIPESFRKSLSLYNRIRIKNRIGLANTFLEGRPLVYNTKEDIIKNYVHQFRKAAELIPTINDFYFYPYDPKILRDRGSKPFICSVTADNGVILNTTLSSLRKDIEKCKNDTFKNAQLSIVNSIDILIDKAQKKLLRSKESRAHAIYSYLNNIKDAKPTTFDEALQKILFFNALFWQMDHWHVGLGRLDYILWPYYQHDIEKDVISKEDAKHLLREFILTLSKDMRAKSASLYGDTGQYILLGGIDKGGNTVNNDLTRLFLEITQELNIPDPKLILRVNGDTSDEVWLHSTNCISTGCGSPLIMNEELIMKGMIEFGYKKEDVWNVGTSACWEPLIIGKSFDQNNPFCSITVLKSLNQILYSNEQIDEFPKLLNALKNNIANQIKNTIKDIEFDVSPLYTLFFDSCIKKEKDFSLGGADYSYHGVEVVSLPNLVNSLLNIQKYVFEDKTFTIVEVRNALLDNFVGHEDMRTILLSNPLKYGKRHPTVVNLTNDIMQFISDEVSKYTCNGTKLKVGFSSSAYITLSKSVKASTDGRKDYEPFAVHISPLSKDIDINEILDFAGSLNYSGNRMNGNVVDFILPKSYLENKEKLIAILKHAMTTGVYELQLNVLDAETLKDAKLHPEKYPNLVVRVWGFSAYFNDLPEEYKDNLIKRAESYGC